MEIYIVRHGDARDPTVPWLASDDLRPLTTTGRDEVALMARLLGRLSVQPDAVLGSPLTRAQQTAEIIAEMLDMSGGAGTCLDMAPGGSPDGVLHDLTEFGTARAVVLTGHMPDVGQLTGYLAWNAPDFSIPFRTGEVCRIDLPDGNLAPGTGDFRWLIPPRIARMLLRDL